MPTERVFRTIVIEAPIERVFQVMADPLRTPEWLVGVRAVSVLTPGPIRVGSETRSRVDALGREWDARGRCVELTPPTRIVIETTMGPGLKSRSDSRLEPAGESRTTLSAELAFQRPGGPVGVLFNAFGAAERIERDFSSSLHALKQLIERTA